MMKFIAEKNFFMIFQASSTYFSEEIKHKNWGYLIHEGSFEHYILSLMEEFYNSFTNSDIDNHAHRICINWRGERKVLDLQSLSNLSRIPLVRSLN